MKRREFLTKLGIAALALPLVSTVNTPDISISFGNLLPKFDSFSADAKAEFIANIRQIEAKTNLEKRTVKELAQFFEKRMQGKSDNVLNITLRGADRD